MENTVEAKTQIIPPASAIIDDDSIVEMTFRPEERQTFFAIYVREADDWAAFAAKQQRLSFFGT